MEGGGEGAGVSRPRLRRRAREGWAGQPPFGGGEKRRKQRRRHLLRLNVSAGGSRKNSVARVSRARDPASFACLVPRGCHASPLGPLGEVAAAAAAAATTTPRIGVGNAGRLPSPPCPRIKVMLPGLRDHDSARPGLSGPARGRRVTQAAVTFHSAVPAPGCRIRSRFGAWERSWEVTTVFQFGHIGVEPTPFL